jgi:cardiolipin synthase A/B
MNSHWLPSTSQHLLFGAVALLIYVLTTRAGQIRRPPASAIAWVMGLWLFPYLFLPLYLIFGQRKYKAPKTPGAGSARREHHWAAALIQSFGLPPPATAAVRFHADGTEARAALWELIDGARRSLDLCTFIVGDDVLGRELLTRLTRRAREGVHVRLLVDGAGLWLARPASFEPLRSAGGEVKVFRPLLSLRRRAPRNLRNHRKLVVADGERLWSGGRNFAAEYFCGETGGSQPWIDLSFDLGGNAAGAAARQFAWDWSQDEPDMPNVPTAGKQCTVSCVQYLPSGPDQAEDTVHAVLLSACARAEHSLLAVTPYFVPDESLLTALRMAVLRGVRLTLILPGKSNHLLADFVRSRALRALADAGADILLVGHMVHAKALVVDESLALCGSVNLDARSLLLNYESEFLFYGEGEIRWLSQWLARLAAQGEPFVPRAPGLLRDLIEGVMLTVAFQL